MKDHYLIFIGEYNKGTVECLEMGFYYFIKTQTHAHIEPLAKWIIIYLCYISTISLLLFFGILKFP